MRKQSGWLVMGLALLIGAPRGAMATPVLVADYQFNDNFASAVAGAPDLQQCDFDMAHPSNPDGIDVLSEPGVAIFAARTGFVLDTTDLLTGYGNDYSVLLRVRLSTVDGWYGLAYGSPVSRNNDDGFYMRPGRYLSLWNAGQGNYVGDAGHPITADTWVQMAYSVTPNAGNPALVDIAGTYTIAGTTLSGTFTGQTDPGHGMTLRDADPRLVLFRGYYNDDTAGAVDRIQIYQGGMTAAEMAAIDLTLVPEPGSLVLLGLGVVALRMRRLRKA